jgi:DegV family protein with EDD domain
MTQNSIAIVTGSCAQVPRFQQEEMGVKVLPFTIHVNGTAFMDDGIEITPSQIYRLMRSSKIIPTTAPPSTGDYFKTFQSLFEMGYTDIIYLSISEKLSSDYATAVSTANIMNSNYSDCRVHVIDSCCAAIPQGFLAIEAAEKVKRGMKLYDILHWLEQAKNRVGLVASLETLEYLARGGRIGKASKFLGSMLDIKPLLSLIDGVVTPIAIQRGSKKILSAIIDAVRQKVTGWETLRLAVMHADDPDRARLLMDMVKDAFKCDDIYLCELTPMMGVHVGPGLIGLGYYFE